MIPDCNKRHAQGDKEPPLVVISPHLVVELSVFISTILIIIKLFAGSLARR